MISWGMGVVLCLFLLTGCGTSHQNLAKVNTAPPPAPALSSPDTTPDEPLTEELSAKRLEELYAKSGIPGWDPGLEKELKKWDHQIKFDVPIHTNKQVRAYLVYFSTERKEVIRRYLARSTRYLPMIKSIFQEYGLPEDLAYLAMIESGFNSHAYSPAHACGMWQFIRGTGLRYGLAINSYVDERRDPEKATRAAAKYLLDLYKQFGSWYLAAASYNCGEGRVQKELNQSNHKNFWELSANQCLPNETKNYVPQMIAATIIAKNPEKFGFKRVPYLPPLAIDKVQVKETTSLKAAAMAVNVPVEEIQTLNPALLRGITPPDLPYYSLNLPAKSKEVFAKNITMARLESPAVASRSTRVARGGSSSRHHYHSRSRSHHHSNSHYSRASKKARVRVSSHTSRKSKVKARKSSRKGRVRVASAKKRRRGHKRHEKASVQTASMLPVASPARTAHKERAKVASRSKGKEKAVAKTRSKGKKGGVHLAKKGTSKKRGKGKTSSRSRRKGKSRGSRLMVSEAR